MSSKGPKTTKKETTDTTKSVDQSLTGLTAAQPLLGDIANLARNIAPGAGTLTPAQEAALSELAASGNFSQQFLPGATGLLSGAISGTGFGEGADLIRGGLETTGGLLRPLIERAGSGDVTSDPLVQQAIDLANERVNTQVARQFGASGRGSPAASGIGQRALARGAAEATIPLLLGERARQESLGVQGAGLLSNINIAGAGALDDVTTRRLGALGAIPQVQGIAETPARRALEVEAIRSGIPLQNIGLLTDIAGRLSGTQRNIEGTTTGRSESVSTSQTKDPNALLKLALSTGLAGASLFAGPAGLGALGAAGAAGALPNVGLTQISSPEAAPALGLLNLNR